MLYRLPLVGTLCALLAPLGAADVQVQTVSIPSTTTEWTATAEIEAFNPEGRVLTGVRIILGTDQISTLQFENTDSQPSTVNLRLETAISLLRPGVLDACGVAGPSFDCEACGDCLLTVPLTMEVEATVEAFDGNSGAGAFAPDFAGPSGRTFPDMVAGNRTVVEWTWPLPQEIVEMFVGTAGNPGTLTFGLRAGGSCQSLGSSNLISRCQNMADANVSFVFTDDADCNGNGIPDGDDVANGTSADCDGNQEPDECQSDCDDDGQPDACEADCDSNGIPDECDPIPCCDPVQRRHGASLLLFPEFDGRSARRSIITVTNTSRTEDVRTHWIYVGKTGDTGYQSDCQEFDRYETLTPNDTLSVMAHQHNPQDERGFLYVYAVDAYGNAVSANHLIGHYLAVDGIELFEYAMNAVDFGSPLPQGSDTDIDHDGVRDLNGSEYDRAPNQILIPRFMGQMAMSRSRLILISLSGGAAFETTAGLLIYNDNEEVFSGQHTFRCWDQIDALEVSNAFSQKFLRDETNHDIYESLRGIETGWARVFGQIANSATYSIQDPAIYAVWIEVMGGMAAADLPFELCSRSGHLLPRSVTGDNEE